MEDAVSLSICLQRGTQPGEVPERLRLYESIRIERANRIQQYSRVAGSDLGTEKKLDSKRSHHSPRTFQC
jgi:2-polyprenyl-6-methoxyphenol hydroxylase-like FAD-dependent oxidoreductase